MGYKADLIRSPQIDQAVLLIRGQRVMLDRDLAAMYGVSTGNLNKAVQRNLDRFPVDFMFQLTAEEAAASRFQIGILKRGLNIKYLPYVFTQEGVAMLSGVLRSTRAVQVNVAIMRAFVRLRETLALHKELAHKLAGLERKIENHDENIRALFEAIHQLMVPPESPRKEIGFHVKEDSPPYRIKPGRKKWLN
jgi:ORF6N domain